MQAVKYFQINLNFLVLANVIVMCQSNEIKWIPRRWVINIAKIANAFKNPRHFPQICNYLKLLSIILSSFYASVDVHVYIVNYSNHKSLHLVSVMTSHISKHICDLKQCEKKDNWHSEVYSRCVQWSLQKALLSLSSSSESFHRTKLLQSPSQSAYKPNWISNLSVTERNIQDLSRCLLTCSINKLWLDNHNLVIFVAKLLHQQFTYTTCCN